jgi:hypothetical protein
MYWSQRIIPAGLVALTVTLLVIFIFMQKPSPLVVKSSKARALSTWVEVKREPASQLKARGFNVTIAQGEVAYLDESTNIDTLTINGTLYCDEANAAEVIELRVKTIYVNGTFQCGTTRNPYKKKLIISLKHSDLDPRVDHGYRGILIMNGGKFILNGDRKNAGWYRLGETAMPGDESILLRSTNLVLQEPVLDKSGRTPQSLNVFSLGPKWNIGDKIVLAPTGFNFAEAEEFTITDIDPSDANRLYLDRPIQYMHWGERKIYHSAKFGKIPLDESAEVANLTRSIVIRADEASGAIDESNALNAQQGGHIMVHHGGEAYLDAIELYKMGQAGIMARYPFHWHYVGNAPGQFIKNSSVHHSFQRCIVIHRTHKTLVQNNVCYNFKGHGYFLEDGNEIENKLIKNLAIMAKAPSLNKLLLASDNISQSEGQGRFPSVSGFWISHPNNYIVNNVVAGSVGTGFWMSFEAEVKNGQGFVVARPLTSATDTFNNNIAHATKVGFTWDGAPGWESANNPNNPDDKKITSAHYEPPVVPVFKGLVAYKNSLSGIYFRGQTAIYQNAIVADNGWSFWLAYNQIIRDSILIGETDNTSPQMQEFYFNTTRTDRYRKTGVVLYDGPFEVHNSDFFDFSTSHQTYTLNNGQTIHSTVIPFTSTGGSNKFTNVVNQLRFKPEPIYRAYLEHENENINARQNLGNAVMRDLDGSLSKRLVNSVIVGKRSLGVMPGSGCQDGGESLKNFKICPSNYSEGSLAFMSWGSNMISPWGTPFVVVRSDGEASYPLNEWNSIVGRPNNLFATINSVQYTYELLPRYQYEYIRGIGATTTLDANTEKTNPIIPVVKIVAYGKNCRLGLDAVQVNSLAALYAQNRTSYYTLGEDFYVRIIPVERWFPISDDPRVVATSNGTKDRYPITCDQGYLPKVVKGEIETVTRTATTTTISGWACNYTHNSAIQVKVYAQKKFTMSPLLKQKTIEPMIFLAQGNSNQSSDAKIAVKCGFMTSAGRKFSITLNNSDLQTYNNHTFYVQGISNSGGQNMFLINSGKHNVLPLKPVLDTASSLQFNSLAR